MSWAPEGRSNNRKVARESFKLNNKEDDWNLNGKVTSTPLTRTHRGGNGRPNLSKRVLHEDSSSSSSELDLDLNSESEDSDWSISKFDSSSSDESEVEFKPPATRVILEQDAVKDL
jgi:hypothetical protein